MSNRQIFRNAREEVQAGRDRQAVFATYHSQVTRPQHLAVVIAGVPRPELRQRWQAVNWVLVGLLGFGALTKLVYAFHTFADRSLAMAVGAAVIGVIVPLAAAVDVARMNGQIYGLVSLLCLIGFALVATGGQFDRADKLVDGGYLMVVLILSQFIKWKVFPHMGWSGPRKDASGQFLLEARPGVG